MIQFYAPDIETTGLLPEEESGHCVRVLRMKTGDTLYATDGRGFRYNCIVTEASAKGVAVDIISKEEIPAHWGVKITLAVAPTKNMDRMEWLVEKCVEMGIDRIVPVICVRSERKIVKTERLRKIIVSAMKQSLKCSLPQLSEPMALKDFLKEDKSTLRYMGYCAPEFPKISFCVNYTAGSDVTILIGPEGDFSPQEVEATTDAGFIPCTFGNSRLRTETAALFAVAAVHAINQANSSI